MLVLNNISLRLGGRPILENASAALPPKSRVGLIGRNGAGKSTLIKIIAGELEADSGRVETPRGTRIGYLTQDAPGGILTPLEVVLAADTERAALLAEEETASDHRIGDIHERLNAINAHGAPARAARILSGLGFDEGMQHQPLNSFSGGWRMRVALAALLFSGPDLLLLDEPSNHLDLEAEIWLESFLRGCGMAMVVISHERDLLNNVVEYILHLQGGRTTLYQGNYDSFERQWRERQATAAAQASRQDARRKELQAFVDRWRYKAHTARQAQSRLKALARMEPVAAMTEDASLTFDFPNPKELRPPLVVLDHVAVGYAPNQPVLAALDLRIDPDDRIAFIGRNGNGKTTLARLLAGHLKPLSGTMTTSGQLRVGYFAQHQIEDLFPDETPLQHMTQIMEGAKPGVIRAQLARFGFSGDKVHTEVQKLSGGERARLALALITREAPHILILDEPTNHLDVDAREALVQALNAYSGAVIIVSHDRHLLELTADRLIFIADGRAREFDGSLEDYRNNLVGAENTAKNANDDTGPRISRKDERRLAAQRRQQTQSLRLALKQSETEMNAFIKSRAEIDQTINHLQGKDGVPDAPTIMGLMKQRAEIERKLIAAEERWLKASASLEESLEAAERS